MRVLFAAAVLSVAGVGATENALGPQTTSPAPAETTHQVIRLWTNAPPGSEQWTQKEIEYGNPGGRGVRNVVDPSITVFLPDPSTATGASVIIAPGGGFRFLQWNNEGTNVAEYLQKHGVASFVLRYRTTDTGTNEAFAQMNAQARGAIPPDSPQPATGAPYGGGPEAIKKVQPLSLADGHQAMRIVRQRAGEWRLDPQKIGIMGFSAGGYVAVTVALDNKSDTRPNFVGSVYSCCLGPTFEVPSEAPPLFIASAQNDPISNRSGPALFAAWTAANKPAEIHIYQQGGHGFGTRPRNQPVDTWLDRFGEWLRSQKLAN
jgi:acetyl esterase/lipase